MRAKSAPFPTQFRLASWLALAAMALNALWPLLVQARPAGVPVLSLICTAQGLRSLPGDPVAPVQPADTASSQLHCVLCSAGGDTCLPQPDGVFASIDCMRTPPVPVSGADAIRPGTYLSPQPRAPPLLA